jgi:hypothetical protein
MSDLVIAALIAASATITASFLQLRAALAREMAARAPQTQSRRKSRVPFAIVGFVLAAGIVGGFAFSQWLTERDRVMQAEIREALEARIAAMARSEAQIQQSRAQIRAEIETGLLRRLGMEGVVVSATVAPCKPPRVSTLTAFTPQVEAAPLEVSSQPTIASVPAAPTCTEADANPVTLCASIPARATVADVELFVRAVGTDTPWDAARVTPGVEFEKARFGAKPVEYLDGGPTKQVCENFVQWSTDQARIARMLVRYTLD